MSETREVHVKQWWSNGGGMMINTSALDPDHEMHPYNQILAQGERPEDFGVRHPFAERFDGKSRDELIARIIQLEKEVVAYAKADAMGVL